MTPPSKPGSRLANLARGRRENRRGKFQSLRTENLCGHIELWSIHICNFLASLKTPCPSSSKLRYCGGTSYARMHGMSPRS